MVVRKSTSLGMTILLGFYRLRVAYKLMLRRYRCIDSFCRHCGRNVRDFVASDDVWAKVEPHIRDGHTLCFDCFSDLCLELGIATAWNVTPVD